MSYAKKVNILEECHNLECSDPSFPNGNTMSAFLTEDADKCADEPLYSFDLKPCRVDSTRFFFHDQVLQSVRSEVQRR